MRQVDQCLLWSKNISSKPTIDVRCDRSHNYLRYLGILSYLMQVLSVGRNLERIGL